MMQNQEATCSCGNTDATLYEDDEVAIFSCGRPKGCGTVWHRNLVDGREYNLARWEYPDGWTCEDCLVIYYDFMPYNNPDGGCLCKECSEK